MNRKIAIVIIRYFGDIKMVSMGHPVIIVDNTPNEDLNISGENIYYIPLKQNIGIASAQNIGIRKAYEIGCSYIIFFDQDSIVSERFIEEMVSEYERISKILPNLFLLGPSVYNGREQREYKSTIHSDVKTDFDFIPRREIISSGSCIAIEKIFQVGLLDSDLFIDYVDFEWCWRANSEGFQNGITPNVKLTHFVGQQEYRIINQLVIISSPIRYFYQTRNFLWLLRYKYVPLSWKFNTAIKRILYPLSFPFKVKQWREIYIQIWRGFIAGIKNK